MQSTESYFNPLNQNNKLPIRIVSPAFGHLPLEFAGIYGPAHRRTYYFLHFMVEGITRHRVDLRQFDITNNELLFILPHKIHHLPSTKQGMDYFKLGFDENCLSLLPKQYPFFINPSTIKKLNLAPRPPQG